MSHGGAFHQLSHSGSLGPGPKGKVTGIVGGGGQPVSLSPLTWVLSTPAVQTQLSLPVESVSHPPPSLLLPLCPDIFQGPSHSLSSPCLPDPGTPGVPAKPRAPSPGSHTVEKERDALGESQGRHEPVDLEHVVPGRGSGTEGRVGASVRGRDGGLVGEVADPPG